MALHSIGRLLPLICFLATGGIGLTYGADESEPLYSPTPAATAESAPIVDTVDESFLDTIVPPGFGATSGAPCESCPSCGYQDWIVSSRCSRQDWDDCRSNGLLVYRRDCDGCLHRSSLSEMRASLDPCTPIAVFVHGSYVSYDWFLKESRATARWFRRTRCDRPLQTVFFTWPSDENARYIPGSVRELTRRAEFNSFYLARLLGCLPVDCRCGGKLTVVGHSHGGLMTAAAMHLLAGGSVQGRCSNSRLSWRANVVLAAAAFDRDWLTPRTSDRRLLSLRQVADRGRYGRAMNVVNQMLLLRNRHDIALKLYPARQLFAKQAIGKAGIWRRDREELGAAACRIHEVDVSRELGCKHVWPHYLASSKIACTVAPYIHSR